MCWVKDWQMHGMLWPCVLVILVDMQLEWPHVLYAYGF